MKIIRESTSFLSYVRVSLFVHSYNGPVSRLMKGGIPPVTTQIDTTSSLRIAAITCSQTIQSRTLTTTDLTIWFNQISIQGIKQIFRDGNTRFSNSNHPVSYQNLCSAPLPRYMALLTRVGSLVKQITCFVLLGYTHL